MTTLLLIGGADTGRAPLAAVILRHLLETEDLNWQISSAGILGHDGDTWQPEARLALEHLGFEVDEHLARSLTSELVAETDLLITVDRGIGRALAMQYPTARWRSLPDLAGSNHEIMDPFRMTLDAWLVYGREFQQQLETALPKIRQIIAGEVDAQPIPASPTPAMHAEQPAIERLAILVRGIQGIPEVIDWQRARNAIRETLQTLAIGNNPSDLRPAAVAMLIGVLGDHATALNTNQLAILSDAIDVLAQPVDALQLAQLATAIGRWS